MRKQLFAFLGFTFGISWICWWLLACLVSRGILHRSDGIFMLPYMLGGFGPTIAAYLTLAVSGKDGGFRQFHQRLGRVRVKFYWYILTFVIALGAGFLSLGITALVNRTAAAEIKLEPWYRFFPLFVSMIFGGGLEELGWRGTMQPEIRKKIPLLPTGLIVGLVWTLWHLPLFFIEGVSQHEMNFWVFFPTVMGFSLMLAWLFEKTDSILLCIVFHAAWNAAMAMGLFVPKGETAAGFIDAGIKLLLGLLLVLAFGNKTGKKPAELP